MVCVRLNRDIPGLEPAPALNAFDWHDLSCLRTLVRTRLANMRRAREFIPATDDDTIPCMTNVIGTGAIAAAFVRDAVVHQEATTNYLDAPITSWDRGIESIGFNPENPYYQAHMACLSVYAEEWDGTYGILPFPYFDPLDLCNQLRGNDIFFDFTDHPAELRALLERCTAAILEMEVYTRGHYLRNYGVSGFAMDCWCPGTYLSCDIGDMISPEILREFGLPYTQRIVSAWGGAFLHHHELGAHQIPTWADCRGLSIQYITRDPNTWHLASDGIDAALIESTFRVPVFFEATYEEFVANAGYWSQGKFIVGVLCNSEREREHVIAVARGVTASLPGRKA